MHALIVVDIQNDFLPGGALAVADGDAVIEPANTLIERFASRGLPVVATQDYHPAGHESFASAHAGREVGEAIDLHGLEQVLWPDHCVQGTTGVEFPDRLRSSKFDAVFPKGTNAEVDSYSGFFDNGKRGSTGLAEWLRERGVITVTIVGLATDYCVKFTALDALAEGFNTSVCTAAVRSVDLSPGDGERAIADLKAAGARCIQELEDVFGAGESS